MKSNVSITLVAGILLMLLPVANAAGQATEDEYIGFEDERWVMRNAQVVEHLGRTCLTGFAYLEGVGFEDGIIEVDVAVDGKNSYPGIVFRMQSEENYERIYIRPHRAGLYPDAVQYMPVFNGIGCWQLYNGEGYTAGVEIPSDEWIHLKLEIKGNQARLYVGGSEEPTLAVGDLKHGLSKGTIGLYGPNGMSACFSNFRYRLGCDSEFDPAPGIATPPGIITDWEISQPFKSSQVDLERTPEAQNLGGVEWHRVVPEADGLVNIARYTGRISRIPDCVFARTYIESDMNRMLNLRFGYSDAVSIFLNGEILFFGNSAYRLRDPSFLGIIGLNDAVYLPLEKGRNELILLVTESFGGWAFICQDADAVVEHESMARIWDVRLKLRMPESVVYDRKRDALYVSNYFNEGKEFISKMKTDGSIEELEWVTGLNRPTGMCIFEDRLFVVDRSGIVEIDIGKGEISSRLQIPEAGFINDISVDSSGNLYVSDSRKNLIYRISGGEPVVWIEGGEISSPNGLTVDGEKLIVGNSGDASIKSVGLSDRKIETIAVLSPGSVIDGLKTDGRGNYLVSDFNGKVFLISPDGDRTLLLDTTVPQLYCADFEYIASKDLIVIPTLYENRVMAYRYSN